MIDALRRAGADGAGGGREGRAQHVLAGELVPRVFAACLHRAVGCRDGRSQVQPGSLPAVRLQEIHLIARWPCLASAVPRCGLLLPAPSTSDVCLKQNSEVPSCLTDRPQLRGDDRFAMVAWRRMFQLLVTVVRTYTPGAYCSMYRTLAVLYFCRVYCRQGCRPGCCTQA